LYFVTVQGVINLTPSYFIYEKYIDEKPVFWRRPPIVTNTAKRGRGHFIAAPTQGKREAINHVLAAT
jgi:hypothetical protein